MKTMLFVTSQTIL